MYSPKFTLCYVDKYKNVIVVVMVCDQCVEYYTVKRVCFLFIAENRVDEIGRARRIRSVR